MSLVKLLGRKDSIATRLLIVVFSAYFVISFSVTVIHMAAEYFETKDSIYRDLVVFQKLFQGGLSEILWNLDNERLKVVMNGMLESPLIVGVKIEDADHKKILAAVGSYIDQNGEFRTVKSFGEANFKNDIIFKNLFWHRYPLTYTLAGKVYPVGEVTLYSSSSVIINKVQYGFAFIITNAFIKTFALWIIFIKVAQRMLARPLSRLTDATNLINLDNLKNFQVDAGIKGHNEMKILEEAFNTMIQKLNSARGKLDDMNQNLELQVQQRTQELKLSLQELEQQNTSLMASNRKLEDLNQTKETMLKRLKSLQETNVKHMRNSLAELEHSRAEEVPQVRDALRDLLQIEQTLLPITNLYDNEQAIRSRRVLLVEPNKKQQIIAKMALGGTGVNLDIISDYDSGYQKLQSEAYDVVCISKDLVQLAEVAQFSKKHPSIVFMTSEDVSAYLPLLMEKPYLSNIVTSDDEDRTFTLKNILITVSKLMSHDLFGLDKYLSWGVDIVSKTITNSNMRKELNDELEAYLRNLGIRGNLIIKSQIVAEELMMNAIYDAPTDTRGKSIYNHLPRTVPIELKANEYSILRFGCDGSLLGISVEDPFGALTRQTILEYLKSCYDGNEGSLNEHKGGAGRGIFLMMESADLLVINVKPKLRTEVIALFNVDNSKTKTNKRKSFHFFSA